MSQQVSTTIAVMGIDIGKKLVPRRRAGSTRRHCAAAAEVVTWPSRVAISKYAALLDRDGGVRWGTSSQPQAQKPWSRCPTDAGEVRPSVFERTEERLPRAEAIAEAVQRANDEVRGDEDRRSARPVGAAPCARAIGQPAHWHHQPDPSPAGARRRRSAGTALLVRRVATSTDRASRRPLPTHGAHPRGPGRRLAPAR
jgi:hypothetical protein